MYFQLSKFSQQHVHGVPPLELPEKQQTVG